jgi:adenylylsulfate kinase-like enzyme
MGFTGVDDPYEAPIEPSITLQGFGASAEENARIVVKYLEDQGYILKQA